jgi:hypothetical protein
MHYCTIFLYFYIASKNFDKYQIQWYISFKINIIVLYRNFVITTTTTIVPFFSHTYTVIRINTTSIRTYLQFKSFPTSSSSSSSSSFSCKTTLPSKYTACRLFFHRTNTSWPSHNFSLPSSITPSEFASSWIQEVG